MPVHPLAQATLDAYNALPPPEEIGVEAARARSRAMSLAAPRGPDVAVVEEGVARCAHAGLPVRVYLPDGCYAGFIHLRLGPDADRDMVADLRSALKERTCLT